MKSIALLIVATFVIAISMSSQAVAFEKGAVTNSTIIDHYKTIIEREPYHVEVCQKVITQGGDPTAGAIIGGIIGGVLGNQVDGKNSGEAGAVIGAIIGIENEKKKKAGEYTQCNKEIRYHETSRTVYSHSELDFEYNGRWYKVQFVK
jgi:uncharacterized protein YcfJ